ncbi:MAG: hypothetical protein HY820_23495 [Acidobacteria bacterium]|nr:hypothetical protein [Acidobacteriota bacterium]
MAGVEYPSTGFDRDVFQTNVPSRVFTATTYGPARLSQIIINVDPRSTGDQPIP